MLRNGPQKDHIIYFGPMGCMTSFYLIVRDMNEESVWALIIDTYQKIAHREQDIPGAKKEECGNYIYICHPQSRLPNIS